MAAFFHPAFRTRRFGDRLLSAGAIVKIGLFTWLLPALVGLVGMLPVLLLAPAIASDDLATVLLAPLGMLILAPIYGVILVPLALLIGAWALRWGIAGWASAAAASAALPLAMGAVFSLSDPTTSGLGAGLLFVPASLVHALVMWAATRHLCPQAFASAP